MNRALLCLAVVAVCNCAPPQPPSPEPQPLQEHTTPPRVEATPTVTLYAELGDDGTAAAPLQLAFALDEAFPTVIDVKPTNPSYVTRGCDNGVRWGPAAFRRVSEVTGDAASLSIIDGALRVELKHEGRFSARVEGDVYNSGCEFNNAALEPVPTWHVIELRVTHISRFSVTHATGFNGCGGPQTVIAAGRPTSLPTVTTHDAEGAAFRPLNAPEPVQLMLRGDFTLTDDKAAPLLPGRGAIAVTLNTALPVEGLHTLMAVAPSDLVDADVELGFVQAHAKGSGWHALEDGADFRLFYPEQDNVLAVRSPRFDTRHGALCGGPASDWFEADIATPDTCEATSLDEPISWQPVAKVTKAGECRATVRVRGTSFSWPARFSTTW